MATKKKFCCCGGGGCLQCGGDGGSRLRATFSGISHPLCVLDCCRTPNNAYRATIGGFLANAAYIVFRRAAGINCFYDVFTSSDGRIKFSNTIPPDCITPFGFWDAIVAVGFVSPILTIRLDVPGTPLRWFYHSSNISNCVSGQSFQNQLTQDCLTGGGGVCTLQMLA